MHLLAVHLLEPLKVAPDASAHQVRKANFDPQEADDEFCLWKRLYIGQANPFVMLPFFSYYFIAGHEYFFLLESQTRELGEIDRFGAHSEAPEIAGQFLQIRVEVQNAVLVEILARADLVIEPQIYIDYSCDIGSELYTQSKYASVDAYVSQNTFAVDLCLGRLRRSILSISFRGIQIFQVAFRGLIIEVPAIDDFAIQGQ